MTRHHANHACFMSGVTWRYRPKRWQIAHTASAAMLGLTGALVACGGNGTMQASDFQAFHQSLQAQAEAAILTDIGPGTAETTASNDIPDSIRSLVKADNILLAYDSMDLTGDGHEDGVVILRHPGSPDERSSYICTLLVFHGNKNGFMLISKNSRIVDCEYNDINIQAGNLDLNRYLELAPSAFKFTNENPRGGHYSYSFAYANGEWHLSEAESTYREEKLDDADVDIYRERAAYPEDFGLISIEDFDPERVRDPMGRNKSLVQ